MPDEFICLVCGGKEPWERGQTDGLCFECYYGRKSGPWYD